VDIVVGGWSETSLVDVLEHVSFTVWLTYCNLRCPWCSNSRLARGLDARRVPIDHIAGLAAEAAPFVDYFHVTGGEPTLQYRALDALYTAVEERAGLPLSLDTNATTPAILARLTDRHSIGHIAIDVKAPLDDPALYARATGITERAAARLLPLIRRGIRVAAEATPFLELRTTLVPGIVGPKEAARTAASIAALSLKPRGRAVYILQQFIPYQGVPEPYRSAKPTPQGLLQAAAQAAARALEGFEIWVRTLAEGARRIT